MHQLIFAINPGTTTTRCAAYSVNGSDVRSFASETLEHPDSELQRFCSITDQFQYRFEKVEAFANRALADVTDVSVSACAGRGGMLTPVPPGVIRVNDSLVAFSLNTPVYQHASNLGAPLAHALASKFGCGAFIADPVSVDQLLEVARFTGSPDFQRFSFVHALNIRATARKAAARLQANLEDLRMVVAHLGAGFSIAAMDRGRLVDNSNRMECSPFTPERCGGLPPIPLIESCYSGKYTKAEMMKRLYREGGVYAYLGTRDMREVESMITAGDSKAELVYDTMLYQIKKAIGAMAAVMAFDIDAIVLTGGLVNSRKLSRSIEAGVLRLASVFRFPGSNETEALAEAVASAISQPDQIMTWPVTTPDVEVHRNTS